MIEKDELETKDFSVRLPSIAARLNVIGTVLSGHERLRLDLEREDYEALGEIISEGADDLKIIARALYGD